MSNITNLGDVLAGVPYMEAMNRRTATVTEPTACPLRFLCADIDLTICYSGSGTVGGKQFGVAKAVNLIAVKVLSDQGSGAVSDMCVSIYDMSIFA